MSQLQSSFPFSIDVQVYNQTTNNYYTQRVSWVETQLVNQVEGSMIVQYRDNGPTKAGLYFMGLTSYRICVFYKEIEDLVIQGGDVKLYYNLQTNMAVEPLSAVYLNGYKKDVTSLTPNKGIWTVIRFGDTDTPGGITGVTLNPDAATFVPVPSTGTSQVTVGFNWKAVPAGAFVFNPVGSTDTVPKIGIPTAADLPDIAPVKSVNGKIGAVALTTTDVPQGTNLYYTDALAKAAAPVQSVAGREGAVVLAVADSHDQRRPSYSC